MTGERRFTAGLGAFLRYALYSPALRFCQILGQLKGSHDPVWTPR